LLSLLITIKIAVFIISLVQLHIVLNLSQKFIFKLKLIFIIFHL